jgi:ribonuclease J
VKNDFSFSVLGGIGEIGANCYLLELEGEYFLIDCGLAFCENLYPGVFASIPDLDSVKELKSNLKGIIITHGHDDHLGALPYFIDGLNVPIYLSAFASELLKNKLLEMGIKKTDNLKILKGKKLEILIGSKKFVFFKTYHSIPESYGFYVTCESGEVVFTSDFKHFDFSVLPPKPLILFLDATNAEVTEDVTESEVRKTIDKIIKNTKGVFIASTFSSNIDRIKSLINLIVKNGRKLFVTGKSVLSTIDIAKKLQIIKDIEITPWDKINKIPRNEVAIITTGTQGEKFSSLKLMSQGIFKGFRLGVGDSVVISSRIIPGNEKNIYTMINKFLSVGVDVYYAEIAKTHCSGHGTAKELKNLLQKIKPAYIIPIHGEMRHLKALKHLAVELGFPPENIVMLEKGYKLQLNRGNFIILKHDNVKRLFLDYHDNSVIAEEVAKERKKLGEEGLIHISMSLKPCVNATFEAIGFRIDRHVEEKIIEEIRQYNALANSELISSNLEKFKEIVKNIIRKHYNRKPVVILDVEGK